ncbi:MAG: hypothetical protein JO112_13600, partial [Planctomycetes bacterium]|nr:hypothetical protein [Planctomycetota bacterium]
LADSRLGVLANDVPDRLQPILEDAVKRDPHLWVLCACSPGQVSLASEDLGQSVFGYYLVQGLNGWADLYNPDHQHNGKVSVRELAEFVAARVDRWAMHNRNVHQTPFLLGPDGDFDLVVLPKGQALKPETLPDSPGPYPDWLRAGWDLRDQWLADQTSVFAPRLFHRLEAVLFRAEQRWRGGIDPKRIQDDLNADIQDLTTRAQAARNKDLPAPHSLALAYTRGLKADPALREDLATLLARLDAMPPLKPEELDQGKKEFLTKFKGTPAELAGAAFDVAVEDVNLSQKKIALLLELVHTPKPAPPASAEILFLERLAQLKADPKQWPVEAVHQALLGVREEQQAIAALTMEPRALPWVRNLFAGVADKRHQGEGLLFQDDPDARPQAKAPFADAENQAYELNQMIQALQKALEYRDQALVFLPAYLPALTSQMDGGDDEETLVRSTVEAFQPLNEMLTKPPELSSLDDLRDRRNELQRLATILRDPLLRLREPFGSKHVAILAAKTPEGVSDLDELVAIDGLFRTPCLNAADRLKLWQRRQELTQKLLQETHEQDKVDDDPKKGKATKSPDRVDVKAASQRVRQRAARRANLALSLFRLGGFDKVEDLNKEITQTAANSAGDWYSEGDTLRRIWADQLPDQFQRLLKKRNLPAAGRLSHILDPFAKEGLDLFGDPRRDPALQLHLRETRAVWQWLADRFQAEGRSLAEPGVYGDFYQKTAQEYQRYAR